MIGVVLLWAMLGPRSLMVIVMVALALYGRSGVLRSPVVRAFWPGPIGPRRTTPGTAGPGQGQGQGQGPNQGRALSDRTFWFLTVLAATAVAAWIVTRTIILGGPGVSH